MFARVDRETPTSAESDAELGAQELLEMFWKNHRPKPSEKGAAGVAGSQSRRGSRCFAMLPISKHM